MNYQTKEVEANHYKYKIVYIDTIMHHPSWYSHEDEKDVRERDWHIKPGVWSKSGWLDTTNQNFYTEVPKTIDNPNYFIKVNTLDNWYEGVKSLEDFSKYSEVWMKVDVEGAEVEVLKAATNLLKEIKPNIQVENHLFKNGNIEAEVKKLLEDLGYEQISTHVYHSVSNCVYKAK